MRVMSIKLLGVHLFELSWSTHTTGVTNKIQQQLPFHRVLRNNRVEQKLMVSYHSSIESLLTYCLTVLFAGGSAADRKALQRVIVTGQKSVGCPLPHLEETPSSHGLRRSRVIVSGPVHSAHHLFDLFPPGKRDRSTKAHTARMTNCFYPRATRTFKKPLCKSKRCNKSLQ